MIARHRELPSISRRLTISLILTVAIVSIAVIGLNYYSTSRKAKAQLNKKADEYISFLLNSLRIPLWNFEIETIKHIGSVYSQNELIGALKITGSNGEIYFNTTKDGSQPWIRRGKNIVYNERSVGTVQLSLTSQTYNIYQKQLLRQSIIAMLGVLIAIIGVTGFFLRMFLKKPLAHLSDLMGAYTSGTYDPSVKPKTCMEFQEVVEVFGEMNAKIIKQMSELQAAEEKYRSIFENAVEGIFQSTVEGRFISVNPALARIYGYDSADEVVANLTDIRTQLCVDPKRRKELIRLLDENGVVKDFEAQIYRKDRSIAVTSINARQAHDAKGDMVYLEGSVEDITVRKRAEEALRESEAKYRELVQNANSIILRIDTQGNFTFFNEFAEQFFGYTEREILGKNAVGTIVPETDTFGRDLSAMVVDLAKNPERYAANENENMRRNGERIWIAWTNKAIYNEEGEIVEILCIGNDMTDRKRLENQLLQSQKMDAIGTLAGGIAHDFNNILGGIIGYAELAQSQISEDQSGIARDLSEVLKASDRAKKLVQQILAFSRQTDREFKPVKMSLIVKEALKLLRASLPTTIEIRLNITSDATIWGELTQLHQTIMNLCVNAGHAMRAKGGLLEVTLVEVELDFEHEEITPDLKPGLYLKLTVSDTGDGMHPEVQERIFDPFFTTKEKGKGTGMGLAVVHGIVKSHGGTITVSSEPGKGSVFNVFLPVIEERLKLEKGLDKPIPKGTECILFVDDEETLVDVEKRMLESLGYDVVARTSGIEALELFKAQSDKFDLVITDLTMPKMTGDELAAELLRIKPDMPIILCTGFSAMIDEDKAKAMGMRAFVLKPVLKRDIAVTIRKVLDGN